MYSLFIKFGLDTLQPVSEKQFWVFEDEVSLLRLYIWQPKRGLSVQAPQHFHLFHNSLSISCFFSSMLLVSCLISSVLFIKVGFLHDINYILHSMCYSTLHWRSGALFRYLDQVPGSHSFQYFFTCSAKPAFGFCILSMKLQLTSFLAT